MFEFNELWTPRKIRSEFSDYIENVFKRKMVDVRERVTILGKRRIDIYFDNFKPVYKEKDFQRITSGLVAEDGKQLEVNYRKNRSYQISGRAGSGKTSIAKLLLFLEIKRQLKYFRGDKTVVHLLSQKKNDLVDLMGERDSYESIHYSYNGLEDLKKINEVLEQIIKRSDEINKKMGNLPFNDKYELRELQKKGHYSDIQIPNESIFIDEAHKLFSNVKPIKPLDFNNCPEKIKSDYKTKLEIYNQKILFKTNLEEVLNLSRYMNVFIVVITHQADESVNVSRKLFHAILYSRQSSNLSQEAFGDDVAVRNDLHSGKFVFKCEAGSSDRDYHIVKAILPGPDIFRRFI